MGLAEASLEGKVNYTKSTVWAHSSYYNEIHKVGYSKEKNFI